VLLQFSVVLAVGIPLAIAGSQFCGVKSRDPDILGLVAVGRRPAFHGVYRRHVSEVRLQD
jgi:hypothetical protein